MKLRGEFVVRQVMEHTVAVPVGQTVLYFNGMVMLNQVSQVIWTCLKQETTLAAMVSAVTDAFTVSEAEAQSDILEFLEMLRKMQLLEE